MLYWLLQPIARDTSMSVFRIKSPSMFTFLKVFQWVVLFKGLRSTWSTKEEFNDMYLKWVSYQIFIIWINMNIKVYKNAIYMHFICIHMRMNDLYRLYSSSTFLFNGNGLSPPPPPPPPPSLFRLVRFLFVSLVMFWSLIVFSVRLCCLVLTHSFPRHVFQSSSHHWLNRLRVAFLHWLFLDQWILGYLFIMCECELY